MVEGLHTHEVLSATPWALGPMSGFVVTGATLGGKGIATVGDSDVHHADCHTPRNPGRRALLASRRTVIKSGVIVQTAHRGYSVRQNGVAHKWERNATAATRRGGCGIRDNMCTGGTSVSMSHCQTCNGYAVYNLTWTRARRHRGGCLGAAAAIHAPLGDICSRSPGTDGFLGTSGKSSSGCGTGNWYEAYDYCAAKGARLCQEHEYYAAKGTAVIGTLQWDGHRRSVILGSKG